MTLNDARGHGTPRLEAVDSLRGIAATGVVIVHSLAMFDLGPTGVTGIGYLVLGVPLFFVISAFSMSLAYDGGIGTAAAWKRYALRRFFRIAPLFYVMLAVWLVYYHHLGSPFGGIGKLLNNLTFVFGVTQDGIVPAGWSIGIEMCFYAIFPLLLLRRDIPSALLLLALSLGAAWLANRPQAEAEPYHYWTHVLTNAPYFAAGLLAWRVHLTMRGGTSAAVRHLLLGAGVATAASMVAWGPVIDAAQTYSLPVPVSLVAGWSLAFFLIVLSQSLGATALLDNRVTRFLGKISYSLYLSHPFVIYATGIPLVVKGWLGGPALGLAVPLVTLALAVPVALALYHLIERPFMSLGRRLTPDSRNLAQPARVAFGP